MGSMGCWLDLEPRRSQEAHPAMILKCSENPEASFSSTALGCAVAGHGGRWPGLCNGNFYLAPARRGFKGRKCWLMAGPWALKTREVPAMKGSCPFTHWVMSPSHVHKHLASLQHQQVTKTQRLDTSCCSEGREEAIPGQFLRCRPGNQPSGEGARRYSFFPCAPFQQKDLLPPQKSGADGYSVAPPALALPGKARGSQGGPSLAPP